MMIDFLSINKTLLIIVLIILSSWINNLNYRIFDKNLKKYILGMGTLLIFLMCIKLMNLYVNNNYMDYLHYIPLLYVPTLYYLGSCHITGNKNRTIKTSVMVVSTVFTISILTNNYHKMFFSNKENVGYYLMLVWIFYLIIVSTTNLVLKRRKYRKEIRLYASYIPIVLGLCYTVLHLIKYHKYTMETDYAIVLLYFIGIESMLKLELIPNNLRYAKIFKNSYLPISIISKNGDLIYETKNKFDIPNIIIKDIKNENVKTSYKNPDRKNQVYEVEKLGNNFSIMRKDYSNIERLKKELEIKNEELKKQEEILIKQKNLKDKLLETQINNEILGILEDKIEEKRIKIENIIENLEEPGNDELQEVKRLISYCKRMSNLIISNYNGEIYNKEKLSIILNELLEDNDNVNGVINVKDDIEISSVKASNIYETIFTVLENVRDVGALINIGEGEISILFDKKVKRLRNILKREVPDSIISIKEKNTEDGTNIVVKMVK